MPLPEKVFTIIFIVLFIISLLKRADSIIPKTIRFLYIYQKICNKPEIILNHGHHRGKHTCFRE
jgi:predicted membrane protein